MLLTDYLFLDVKIYQLILQFGNHHHKSASAVIYNHELRSRHPVRSSNAILKYDGAIGDGAKIGAGSMVLKDVPARTTAVGNPGRLIGGKQNPIKLEKLPTLTMDHTSYINGWSDYVI
ncbi:hypothetical protein FNV43_RR13397 [Rhamnella rubrinervis]|uniref:Serine acetyltransferase n=1 Tax=Rhamnella rubrinervis TaxID=2594499 RepID=A0A8K0MF58_9ROSA|nr:hypothetical protein FNV43_RR13397 [Rhamnella rubrinervis]